MALAGVVAEQGAGGAAATAKDKFLRASNRSRKEGKQASMWHGRGVVEVLVEEQEKKQGEGESIHDTSVNNGGQYLLHEMRHEEKVSL